MIERYKGSTRHLQRAPAGRDRSPSLPPTHSFRVRAHLWPLLAARLHRRHPVRRRLPTIGLYHEHIAEGCLMSYGPNVAAFHRHAARYTGQDA